MRQEGRGRGRSGRGRPLRGRGEERRTSPARERDLAHADHADHVGQAGEWAADEVLRMYDSEEAGREPDRLAEAALDRQHAHYLRRKIGRSLAAAAAGEVQTQASVKRRMSTPRAPSSARLAGPGRRR